MPNSLGRVISAGATMNWPTNVHFFGTLRLRHFGDSPLTEDGSIIAKNTTLLNLEVGYKRKQWGITLDILNLLNSESWDIGYFYTSRLPGEPASGVPDTLFHPVIPRSIRGSIFIHF